MSLLHVCEKVKFDYLNNFKNRCFHIKFDTRVTNLINIEKPFNYSIITISNLTYNIQVKPLKLNFISII